MPKALDFDLQKGLASLAVGWLDRVKDCMYRNQFQFSPESGSGHPVPKIPLEMDPGPDPERAREKKKSCLTIFCCHPWVKKYEYVQLGVGGDECGKKQNKTQTPASV